MRINTLQGFTIAGYNRRRIAAFAAANHQPDPNHDDRLTTERRQLTSNAPGSDPADTPPSAGADPPG